MTDTQSRPSSFPQPAEGTGESRFEEHRSGWWRRRYERWESWLLGALSLLAFTALWELVARNEVINPVFTSYPSAIWTRFLEMYFTEGDIWFHLAASGRILLIGFTFGVVLGILLGFAAGRSKRFRYVADPYLIGLYATPTVAFLPLLILWFGIGDTPKIVLVCVGTMFPVLINTQAGVMSASPALMETARSFRANRWQALRKVALPWSVPFVLAGIRLGIGRALIMVFVSELIISNRGIGFVVANAAVSFRADRMFVGILTLTIAGVVATKFVAFIEERKFSYGRD